MFRLGIRRFTSVGWLSALPKKNKLPPRPKWLIVELEIEEKFLKGGSGPGGQKINKSNSKVQLTHKPSGLVVTCQYSRSQEQNRKKAREILALKLEQAQNAEGCRTAILNQRKARAKQNKAKKSSKKYAQLEMGKSLVPEEPEPIDVEEEFEMFLKNIKQDPKT
jgi:protein subunit release factor B